ncbi:Hypothetical protein KVN_LOCUS437 [uncultured virus]|nr:Hypothetical protein KVN_LOCUS437 [uncultured virus]
MYNYKKQMSNTNLDGIVNDFNNLLLTFVKNLSLVCPNSFIATNGKLIERSMLKTENRLKFIEVFIAKILQYKKEIQSGNEEFFLNKSYDDDLDGDKNLVNKVFEFKTIWEKLNNENKQIVKQYMSLLCELSETYFLEAYN